MPGPLLGGKVALVTGAGSGIGRASALAFAREGARVAVCDLDAGGGEETVTLIEAGGGEAVFVPVDVSDAAEVEAMVARTVHAFGRLDCAHNNAGVSVTGGLVGDLPEELWRRTLEVNLTGVFLCMQHEIRQMLAQGSGGAIVNTSSAAGLIASPGLAAYVASKHGVIGVTKAAAVEYAGQGIRVNAVCPGGTRTPPLQAFLEGNPGIEKMLVAGAPAGRLAEPPEIAEAVVWLCSDAASFVIGHAMVVDGGAVAV